MLKEYKQIMLIASLFSTTIMANDNVKFDIKMPSKISIKQRDLIYSVSIKNTSNKSVCVPEYLLGGIAIVYWYELYDELGNALIPGCIHGHHNTPAALGNKRIALPPKKRRTTIDSIRVECFFPKTGRYRMIFYWNGFLDGDTEGELSQFSCEKWIEITK